MKRREYGINLDDGVALSTEEEFRLLYVPCNPDETARLQEWFADDTQEPLLLGGQIGSGKTTILNEVSRSFNDAQIFSVGFILSHEVSPPLLLNYTTEKSLTKGHFLVPVATL